MTSRAEHWLRKMVGAEQRADGDAIRTETQRAFVRWNAERLGISVADSQARYLKSWNAVEGGHKGRMFREINGYAHELQQVFWDDSEGEVFEAYRAHAPMHFLRMLSYAEPTFDAADPLVRELTQLREVTIVDFGCGLAQRSRGLAMYLKQHGVAVQLYLADIPTMRREFLVWLGGQTQIPTTFLACTKEQPIPELPPCQLAIATDFFEHVHDPLAYFDRIDAALAPGGLLVSDTVDHHAEFMHVSPKLGAVRDRLKSRGYNILRTDELFQKPR